jgi:hypothetical protein
MENESNDILKNKLKDVFIDNIDASQEKIVMRQCRLKEEQGINTVTEESQEIYPEISAWLDGVVENFNRLDRDEKYREEITAKGW